MSIVAELPTRTSPVPPRPSPVEYVGGLPVEDQEAILFFLVRELVAANGETGWIPVTAPDGHLGSFLPAKAEQERFDRLGPTLTPEERAEMRRRIDHPGRCVSFEEMLQTLREDGPAATR
jgi:hypothetical protein